MLNRLPCRCRAGWHRNVESKLALIWRPEFPLRSRTLDKISTLCREVFLQRGRQGIIVYNLGWRGFRNETFFCSFLGFFGCLSAHTVRIAPSSVGELSKNTPLVRRKRRLAPSSTAEYDQFLSGLSSETSAQLLRACCDGEDEKNRTTKACYRSEVAGRARSLAEISLLTSSSRRRFRRINPKHNRGHRFYCKSWIG